MHNAFESRRCILICALLSSALFSGPAANSAVESMCDQEAVESLATRLENAPEVKAAKEVVRDKYLLPRLRETASDPRAGLETAIEEMAFSALLEVAGSDSARTHVIWHISPAHVQGDQVVPGSRFAFDNPDRVYRFAPISPDSSYEIHGRFKPGAKPHKFVIETKSRPVGWGGPKSVLILEDSDIKADGSFVVTADASPAGNRKAYLYIPETATHIWFRDTLVDWSNESPAELTLRRTAGKAAAPASFESLTLRAPEVIENYANAQYEWIDLRVPAAGNTVLAPVSRGGPQSWGATAGGSYQIAADEAFVFTLDPQSATYLGIQISGPWLYSIDYARHTSSLNLQQVSPNPDGTVTYVIARRDPGVANWLDTDGLNAGSMLVRWEYFKDKPDSEKMVREQKVVKLVDLKTSLRFPMPTVSTEERKQLIKQRTAAVEKRFSVIREACRDGAPVRLSE